MIRAHLQAAVFNMMVNKVRSALSMLGIVIGTASVIVVVSIVNGSRQSAIRQTTAGRENMFLVQGTFSDKTNRVGQIKLDDFPALKKIPGVRTVLPVLDLKVTTRGTFGWSKADVAAADEHTPFLYPLQIVTGRFFSEADGQGRPRLCVISSRLSDKLFGFDFPVGQYVRLPQGSLEVVGVFKSDPRLWSMGQTGDLLVPVNTGAVLQDQPVFYTIQIRAHPGKMDEVKSALLVWFKSPLDNKEIILTDVRDELKDTSAATQGLLLQMMLVAGISLVVGGVGLMNVMLTTVAERTHEIGLRKAVGADSRAILRQFLIEALLLSSVGGAAGIGLGVFFSYAVQVMTDGKVAVSLLPLSLFASFSFSFLIGVVFGLFPASKAARLSPVEALRYE